MNSIKTKAMYGATLFSAILLGVSTRAFAAADTDVVGLATDAGTSIKDTAIGVLTVLIPLAVGVFLARKALPWAKRMVS